MAKCIVWLPLLVLVIGCEKPPAERYKVIEKIHQPDTQKMTSVIGVSSSGSMVYGVASTGNSEAWILVCRGVTNRDNVASVKVPGGVWLDAKPGDEIMVECRFYGCYREEK